MKYWFSYDDVIVTRAQFVNKNNQKVLTEFMKSAAILFYVNYTAVPVHSNNILEHNENDETQSLVNAEKMPPPHHQQSPPHHQSKDRTNLPMKLPRLHQSICTHRMIFQRILPQPSCDIVIELWIHFL